MSPDSVRLFFLCNTDAKEVKIDENSSKTVGDPYKEKWNFRALTYKATTVPVEGTDKKIHKAWGKGSWVDEEEIKVTFKESFHAFISSTDYFFVTESGKLYVSHKPADKGPRTVEAVWQDAKKPITHVITDADQNKTYAFGDNQQPGQKKNQEKFYFKLQGAEPKLTYFHRGQLQAAQVEEPLKTILEYARLIMYGPQPGSDEPEPDLLPEVGAEKEGGANRWGWWLASAALVSILVVAGILYIRHRRRL